MVDNNIIALDYLKIAGAKSLHDLEKNHQYFWQKYQEEVNRNVTKKQFFKTSDIEEKVKKEEQEFLNKFIEKNLKKINCPKCNKELFQYSEEFKAYIVPEEISFMRDKDIVKIKCSCGSNSKYKKTEDNNFNEIKIVQERLLP